MTKFRRSCFAPKIFHDSIRSFSVLQSHKELVQLVIFLSPATGFVGCNTLIRAAALAAFMSVSCIPSTYPPHPSPRISLSLRPARFRRQLPADGRPEHSLDCLRVGGADETVVSIFLYVHVFCFVVSCFCSRSTVSLLHCLCSFVLLLHFFAPRFNVLFLDIQLRVLFLLLITTLSQRAHVFFCTCCNRRFFPCLLVITFLPRIFSLFLKVDRS